MSRSPERAALEEGGITPLQRRRKGKIVPGKGDAKRAVSGKAIFVEKLPAT